MVMEKCEQNGASGLKLDGDIIMVLVSRLSLHYVHTLGHMQETLGLCHRDR